MRNRKTFVRAAALALCALALTACSEERNPHVDLAGAVDLMPARLSEDGRWSMIDAKGGVVYDDEFQNEPTLAYNGVFSVEEGEGYTLYRAGGEKPEAVKGCEGLKAVGYMEEGLVPVVWPDSRIALVDAGGEKKFELGPVGGHEVTQCAPAFSYGRLAFETDEGKGGYVDTRGEVVVEPVYDVAMPFSEDLAVVGRNVTDSASMETAVRYAVIDKGGQEVFRLKEGYKLVFNVFLYGRLVAEDDNGHCVLLDRKGEAVKLPRRVHRIRRYNAKYILFENDEGAMGVCDFAGEVLIRPKYKTVDFAGDDRFFAVKEGGDDEVLVLDAGGEELQRIDYAAAEYVGGDFGVLARDGKTYVLLDGDFKPKGKDEYYAMGFRRSHRPVTSDYFEPAAVAEAVASLVTDKGVGEYAFGVSAQTVLKGADPRDFANRSLIELVEKEGFRYKIEGRGIFSDNVAEFQYGEGGYLWKPEAKLRTVVLSLTTGKPWSQEGYKLLVEAFKKKGFKSVREGQHFYADGLYAVLKKGRVAVGVEYSNDDAQSSVTVADATDSETMEGLMSPFGEEEE